MRKRTAEQCAYCSKPLRLVAGFCAQCHAPAAIAQRAKLIADARRHSAAHMASSPAGLTTLAVTPTTTTGPLPRWTRFTLIIGLVSLVVAVFFITLHLNGNTLPLPFLPGNSSLIAGATIDGSPTTTFSAGETFYLRYAVTVTHAGATIQLRVAPAHAPDYLLTELWPRGDTQRTLPLLALAPGNWQITLLANGQVVRSLALLIGPPTSS